MKKIRYVMGCLLNFPFDLIRLTIHSWEIATTTLISRLWYNQPEQRCPFCQNCDQSVVPRRMNGLIRYWNIWLIRLLLPHVQGNPSARNIRKIIICRNETGYLKTPWHSLILALILTLFWVSLCTWFML